MKALTRLLTPTLNFIQENFAKIALAVGIILLFYLTFYLTIGSLKRLRVEIFSYYPFDRFFPRSGEWSVGYFLIAILLLGLLIFFLIKGEFYLGPA